MTKNLTPADIKQIQDRITVAKNLIELKPGDEILFTPVQLQAAERIFGHLMDAEAIIFSYFSEELQHHVEEPPKSVKSLPPPPPSSGAKKM